MRKTNEKSRGAADAPGIEAPQQLTCERCGNKTDAGAWVGFVYIGAECLTAEDKENL